MAVLLEYIDHLQICPHAGHSESSLEGPRPARPTLYTKKLSINVPACNILYKSMHMHKLALNWNTCRCL